MVFSLEELRCGIEMVWMDQDMQGQGGLVSAVEGPDFFSMKLEEALSADGTDREHAGGLAGRPEADPAGKQEEGDLAFAEGRLRVGTGFLEPRAICIRRTFDLRGNEHIQLEPGVLALAPLVQEALDQLEVYRPQVPEQPALVFLAELIPSLEEMSLPGFLRLGYTDLVGL